MKVLVNPKHINFSEDEFFEFCVANKELRFERNSKGQLIIMAPTGLDTSFDNLDLGTEVNIWNRQYQLGKVSDSNGGYTLPNGSMYAPDVAWISHERWNTVPKAERKKFAHICPNFVIELMSDSDSLVQAKAKMEEWIENGVQLAWLINPKERKTYIYRENGERIIQDFQQKLSGENVLPHFELDLLAIFKED
ncbi:MAG: Uma2 family endonuclease [Microscillaceae bacterium]|jgi:Uma2 family endonuclease|nr:Uma2 family endonuclease [Microscillaceae bacterium]